MNTRLTGYKLNSFGEFQTNVGQDLKTHEDRINELESRVKSLENQIIALHASISALKGNLVYGLERMNSILTCSKDEQ